MQAQRWVRHYFTAVSMIHWSTESHTAPDLAQKMWWCPHSKRCYNLTAQRLNTVKYSLERGIIALHFREKYASVSLPFLRKRGGLVQVSFKSVARFTIVQIADGTTTVQTQRYYGEWHNSSHLVSIVIQDVLHHLLCFLSSATTFPQFFVLGAMSLFHITSVVFCLFCFRYFIFHFCKRTETVYKKQKNSSIFSLIRMHWLVLPSARACRQ